MFSKVVPKVFRKMDTLLIASIFCCIASAGTAAAETSSLLGRIIHTINGLLCLYICCRLFFGCVKEE